MSTTYIQKTLQTVEATQWDGTVDGAFDILDWVRAAVPNAMITYDDSGLVQPPRPAPVIRMNTKFGQEVAVWNDWITIDGQSALRIYKPDEFNAIFETMGG